MHAEAARDVQPAQGRRNRKAAETFLRRVMDGGGIQPRVVISNTLASCPPAMRRVLRGVEHRRHKGLNHRAEHTTVCGAAVVMRL